MDVFGPMIAHILGVFGDKKQSFARIHGAMRCSVVNHQRTHQEWKYASEQMLG